jgi:hypothetical protein
VLSESDLDNAVLGLLYITQEAEDSGATNAISKDLADNLWDAESIRIKNVATPTGSADAVTKTYVDGLALYNSPVVPQLYSFTATASQTAFTLDPAPTSTDVQSFIVDLDGVVQKPTTDFTVSGSTLTLTSGASLAQVLTVRNIGIARDILGDSPSTTGDLTVGDDLVVTDDASVGGDLTVTGAISGTVSSGNVTSTGSTTARSLATRFAEVVNVKDYGAVGDGSTDDTTAIQAAIDSGGDVFVPEGTYMCNGLSLTTSFDMSPAATLKYNGAANGKLITIASANLNIHRITADGNNLDCTLIYISSDGCTIDYLNLANVVCSTAATSVTYGVNIQADLTTISTIRVKEFTNTGGPSPTLNRSAPQAVHINGDSTIIDTLSVTDGCSGLLTSSGQTTCTTIRCEEMHDNGIYHLGGDLFVDSLYYEGDEEACVAKGTNLHVGTITTLGGCNQVLGLQDADNVSVGSIIILPDPTTNLTASNCFNTRSGNTATGHVYIGRISGELRGTIIGSCDSGNGTVEYLTINAIQLRQTYYDDGNSMAWWLNLLGCKGFNIADIDIVIVDAAGDPLDSTSTYFYMKTLTPTKSSWLGSFRVSCKKADGVTAASGWGIRGQGFADANVRVESAPWRTDSSISSPYLKNIEYGELGTANDVTPSTGTWRVGQKLYDKAPSAGGSIGAVCTVAGTPGTWKTFGDIAS